MKSNEKLKPKLFSVMKTYSKEQFVKDLVAGIIVAIIALPLSIALALASGVTPEKGIYTAIVAGFVISFLGWLLEKNNWDSLGKKYRTMHGYFEKAIKIVEDEKKHSLSTRRRAIKDLMLLCHQENSEWKSIKNESKPEPMI